MLTFKPFADTPILLWCCITESAVSREFGGRDKRIHKCGKENHPVCAAKGPRKNNLAFWMPYKSWAVIDRPYSLGRATVGALYERPEEMPSYFCALR